MPTEPGNNTDLDRMARDWMVRVQLGDASGPGETDGARAEALAAFEAWRLADPAHAAAVERVKKAVDKTRILPTGLVFMNSRLKRASFHERHPVMTTALAACLVAVAGAGIHLTSMHHAGTQPAGAFSAADAIYVTMVGETRNITLPDGSQVLLDADSQLRIQYSSSARTLRLDRGRARFTVAHENNRAFAVDAGDGRIIAHGTIFDVAVSAHGVHVALLRGAIEVERPGVKGLSSANGPSRQLSPGQEISYAPKISLPLPEPTYIDGLDWVSGRLSFENTRLGDAADEINRYNTVKIVLARPALGDLRVSGGFEARNPAAFADVVAKALSLHIARGADGRLVLEAGANQVN